MGRTAQIEVQEAEGGWYEVTVDEFVSARDFRVTLPESLFERFSKGRAKDEFIRDSFRFLLAREPKESILAEFDIGDIPSYFPEFESEI